VTYYGRDFSSYQGDLTPADCAGISFAYVKATEGDSYKNPYAVQQVQMLRSQNVHVGLYHFWDPGVVMLDQLHNLQNYAASLSGTSLPLALDVETSDPLGWQSLASDMAQFALNVKQWSVLIPNPQAVFYVNGSFYDALAPLGFPWGNGIWYADPGVASPSKPCLVWQPGPRPVAGVTGDIDFDQFMGTDAQWAAFTLTAPTPQPTYPTPPAGTYDALVPGYGIPGDPEVGVIGQMVNGSGLYRGRQVGGGVPVYAGEGDPTTWKTGFDIKTLPIGTPLAVLETDLTDVNPAITTVQF
jgi:lysozyme